MKSPEELFEQQQRDREFCESLRPVNLLRGFAIGGIVALAIGFIALGALVVTLILKGG